MPVSHNVVAGMPTFTIMQSAPNMTWRFTLDSVGMVSFSASLASLVLAIIAIWLSIVFYRMSTVSAEQTKDAAKGIAANVERLEKLFDRLYSDTFAMVKDTVTDMRRHVWPEEKRLIPETQIEERANEKVAQLRGEVTAEIKKILDRQAGTDQRVKSLAGELSGVVERAITESRRVDAEAREETLRDQVLKLLTTATAATVEIRADKFVESIATPLEPLAVIEELERMQRDGLVEFNPPLRASSKIRISKKSTPARP
ncbi:MAG: hypothetical protein ACRD3J_14255 [Thermoanaerobaculia bacterium]